jgi:oxygen-dependent protoporphyrinogen oxidase
MARRELAEVMGIRAEPKHTSVFAWPEAIAQYTLGHLGRREAMRARVEQHAGLTLCGTSYDGVSFNHAVKSGREAARALAARLWKAPRGGERAAAHLSAGAA